MRPAPQSTSASSGVCGLETSDRRIKEGVQPAETTLTHRDNSCPPHRDDDRAPPNVGTPRLPRYTSGPSSSISGPSPRRVNTLIHRASTVRRRPGRRRPPRQAISPPPPSIFRVSPGQRFPLSDKCPTRRGDAAGTLRAHAARVLELLAGCDPAAVPGVAAVPGAAVRRGYWSADRNVDQTMAQNRTFRQAKASCNTVVTGSLSDLDLVPILATEV